MQARMTNPAVVVPDAMKALLQLAKVSQHKGIPESTLHLVHLRASQINGCGVCVDMHATEVLQDGDVRRALSVSAWRDAPWFSDAERAALALTESMTRLADSADPVPDEIWNAAAEHYDEQALGALVLAVATINVWNRLNVTTRQVAGSYS